MIGHFSAALSEGFCPDCRKPLIPRGKFGYCASCRCLWSGNGGAK